MKSAWVKALVVFALPSIWEICPHHHVFAYTRVCMRIQVLIFFTFRHFECGRGYNTFDPKKIAVFPGTKKVGPICPTMEVT